MESSFYSTLSTQTLNLQRTSEKVFRWFSANHLVVNTRKFHLTIFNLPVDIRITNNKISNEEGAKLLWVNFDARFNFDYPLNTLLKKCK